MTREPLNYQTYTPTLMLPQVYKHATKQDARTILIKFLEQWNQVSSFNMLQKESPRGILQKNIAKTTRKQLPLILFLTKFEAFVYKFTKNRLHGRCFL